jgi:ATP-dependent DNA helicase RecG
MKRNGSPEPILETDEDSNYFLTTLLVHPAFEDLLKESRDQDGNQVNDQVSDQVIRVIRYCEKPHSRSEILQEIGLKNHFDNYQKYIEPALLNQWIEMTIPTKPRSRNQKYLITPKGKAFLASLKD